MRFRKNVPAEKREILKEQLNNYKKEMTMTKEELRELEKWVASGRSPYENGDFIYTEYGYPMDFISAWRVEEEQYNWLMSLSEEEREKEVRNLRGEYDTIDDDIIISDGSAPFEFYFELDADEELPFM